MTSSRSRSGYEPTLAPEEVEILTRWHERAYYDLRNNPVRDVNMLGLQLYIPPEVFPPTPMSDLLGTAVLREVRASDRVLDMGTGCGINALLAAPVAREVVGLDVNPHAVEAARANAKRNGLTSNTTFLQSDLFNVVDTQFDLIVFDPPFRCLKPRDLLERSIADENYVTLTRFMRESSAYLAREGRMLIFFGTSGDLEYLRSLVDANRFSAEVVASRDLERDGITVSYFTFRLAR